MRIDADWLDTVHYDIIRHTLFAQYFALESTRSKVDHREELFVGCVAAYGICVGDVEIELRPMHGYEFGIKILGDNDNSVYFALLHSFACFGEGGSDEYDIGCLCGRQLVCKPSGNGRLVVVDHRNGHLLGGSFAHQCEEEECAERHDANRSEEVERPAEHLTELTLQDIMYFRKIIHFFSGEHTFPKFYCSRIAVMPGRRSRIGLTGRHLTSKVRTS